MSTIVYYSIPFFTLTLLLELQAMQKREDLVGYESRDTWASLAIQTSSQLRARHEAAL